MSSLIGFIVVVLTVAAALLQFAGQYILPKEQKKLADFLADNWYRSATTPTIEFVRKPIKVLRRAFDVVFGAAILSKKAFFGATMYGKVCICIALFPVAVVIVALGWAVTTFPFKRQIHFVVSEILCRAAESEKNAFAFFAVLIAGLAGLITFVARYVL